jgi:Predicted nucleic acid-binding protein, contains PIN domain
MEPFRKIVISDTSCLIALEHIGLPDLLSRLFEQIITTPEVAMEFGETLPKGIVIRPVVNKKLQDELENILDSGESSAIALAIETPDSYLLIDESLGRRVAKSRGLDLTGTVGVLLRAKENHVITAIRPYIEQLELTGFRMSESLIIDVLKEAGEPWEWPQE